MLSEILSYQFLPSRYIQLHFLQILRLLWLSPSSHWLQLRLAQPFQKLAFLLKAWLSGTLLSNYSSIKIAQFFYQLRNTASQPV